jgi:hypothetical protein
MGALMNQGQIVASYEYRDEDGNLIAIKERLDPKSFRWRHPDGKGGFTWGMGDHEAGLYNLPCLVDEDRASEPIYIVEGEKDADRLIELGLLVTCN